MNESTELLKTNQPHLHGPFDIIGDIHGCMDELVLLLEKLGYQITKHTDKSRDYGYTVDPPMDRQVIFVGDLVDRGPAVDDVLRLAMSMVKNNTALCIIGNHDYKLLRKLRGEIVRMAGGIEISLQQLEKEPEEHIHAIIEFLSTFNYHYVLNNGKLVVAHAGLREDMHGKTSDAVHAFCLYGDTDGTLNEYGLPVRRNWAKKYTGKAMVVYGHTAVQKAEWLNNTMDIDTGCVYGGKINCLTLS